MDGTEVRMAPESSGLGTGAGPMSIHRMFVVVSFLVAAALRAKIARQATKTAAEKLTAMPYDSCTVSLIV